MKIVQLKENDLGIRHVVEVVGWLIEEGADPDRLVVLCRTDKTVRLLKHTITSVYRKEYSFSPLTSPGDTVPKSRHVIRLDMDKSMIEEVRILSANNIGSILVSPFTSDELVLANQHWVEKNNIEVGSKVKIREDLPYTSTCYNSILGKVMTVSNIRRCSIVCGSFSFPYNVLTPVANVDYMSLLGKKVWASDYSRMIDKKETMIGVLKSIKNTKDGIRFEVGYGKDKQFSYSYAYIAPFVEEDAYAPFTFEDCEKLMGRVVKDKCACRMITAVYSDNTCSVSGMGVIPLKDLLRDYTFFDGSLCGISKLSSLAEWGMPE